MDEMVGAYNSQIEDKKSWNIWLNLNEKSNFGHNRVEWTIILISSLNVEDVNSYYMDQVKSNNEIHC
jgi:hypothetical protein